MFKIALESIINRHLKKKLLKHTINEEELTLILKEIRTSLLNADVNILILKEFLTSIKNKILSNPTLPSSIKLEQHIWNIIYEELIILLGKSESKINIKHSPTKIMLVGLNGSGKTTTCAKIAHYYQKQKLNVKLVSLDHYRAAATNQLETLAKSSNIPFFSDLSLTTDKAAISALNWSATSKTDILIFDTAGRFQTNEELMKELIKFKKIISPQEILFVADAMSGQEIVNVAKEFNNSLKLTGLIMTKTDADARMGAVISLVSLLKLPIKFLGEGEKIDNLSQYHPDRLANRIIGAGDFATLGEKAQELNEEEKHKKILMRMMSGQFDLEDLLQQMKTINKMGSFSKILNLLPSFKISSSNVENIELHIKKWEVILSSMTKKERRNPKLFKKQTSRRYRVIKGSGCKPDEFNKLIKKWEESVKKFAEFSKKLKFGKSIFDCLN